MSITVLDPTAKASGKAIPLAPPIESLSGRRVGLLDNSKCNVTPLLDHVEAILRSDYGVAEVVRRRKQDSSRPVSEATLAELGACDAILSAVGD